MFSLWINDNASWMIFLFVLILLNVIKTRYLKRNEYGNKRKIYILINNYFFPCFISMTIGWALHYNYAYLNSPDYTLYDIDSDSSFDELLKPVKLKNINITEEPTLGHRVFYTSDKPFLVEVKGFNSLLFCPSRPKHKGFAGIIPIEQIESPSHDFRLHAIMDTKNLEIIIGSTKEGFDNTVTIE